MKRLFKNNTECFVSAFLAGALFLFICFYFKVFPFGTEYCILKTDLTHQYVPMLTQLYDLIKSGQSITYSWSAGLGYSFLGNYLNYLASPFTYIIFLFGRDNIVNAVSIIVLLKIISIAFSFSYYLKKSYFYKGAFIIIPSLLFSFSGWIVAYYWNIMWLDVAFCLPLVIVGLQKLIDKKEPWLYIIVLAYTMLTNYYMAYALCLFLCVYFIYYYISSNEIKKDFSKGFFKSTFFKRGLLFVSASVVSALISAVALLPVISILKSSSAITDSFNKDLEFYFSPFSFWAHQFSGSSIIVQTSGTPDITNAWSGMLTIILLPVYFATKKFSKKERICDFILLGLIFLGLDFNALSFVWHGFHFANGLEDRFAFFYVFIAVTIMAKVINNLCEIKGWHIVVSSVLALVFILIMYFIKPDDTEKYTIIISIAFIIIWLALYLISGLKKPDKSLIKLIAVFALCVEIIFSQMENFDFNYFRESFDGVSKQFEEVCSLIKENDNDLFYRIETSNGTNHMYPMIMNYPGVTNFSSMTSVDVAKSQCSLGLEGNYENQVTFLGQTPVYNSIFGIKYLIEKNDSLYENEFLTKEFKKEGLKVFKNDYCLPLGFCINKETANFKTEKTIDPFYLQGELFCNMCEVGDVFSICQPNEISTKDLSLNVDFSDKDTKTKIYSAHLNDKKTEGWAIFSYSLPADSNYYLYINYNKCLSGLEVSCNKEKIEYKREMDTYFLDPNSVTLIGSRKVGDKLIIKLPVTENTQDKPISVYLASFNKDKFIEGYNKLSQHTLKLTEFENTHFKGEVTAGEDCLLFTSIPYDKGWHITLDGETVDKNDVIAVDDAYISIPLTKGEHTVEFNYFPQGLKAGACISAVTALGLIAYVIINRKKKKEI